MKRFTVEEDREFEIAGEIFRWQIPYWEDIAEVFDRDAAAEANGDAQTSTVRATIEDYIQRIELFIDPEYNDGQQRWQTLAKRKKNPIPYAQFAALFQWLMEVTSRPYPTEQSSPSEAGQQPIAAT